MTLPDGFLDRVDDSGGQDACHAWTGGHVAGGYGTVFVSGSKLYAHRVVLAHKLGRELGRREYALHTCDNPGCVNPRHLYVGDQRQNVRDMIDRGRANFSGLSLGRQPGQTLGKYRVGRELCGTARGYSRHLRHGDPTCDECRAAINRYNNERLAARS